MQFNSKFGFVHRYLARLYNRHVQKFLGQKSAIFGGNCDAILHGISGDYNLLIGNQFLASGILK